MVTSHDPVPRIAGATRLRAKSESVSATKAAATPAKRPQKSRCVAFKTTTAVIAAIPMAMTRIAVHVNQRSVR
jgi:hypothetical protein